MCQFNKVDKTNYVMCPWSNCRVCNENANITASYLRQCCTIPTKLLQRKNGIGSAKCCEEINWMETGGLGLLLCWHQQSISKLENVTTAQHCNFKSAQQGTNHLCFDYNLGKRMAAIFEFYFQFRFRSTLLPSGEIR